jgi:hypothetical protein
MKRVWVMIGVLAAAPVSALDNELFGLRLGAALKLPECPREAKAPDNAEDAPAVTLTSACYKMKTAPASGRAGGAFDYEMPYADWPSVANDHFPIVGYVLEGRIECVEFRTFGIRNGDEVLRFLEKKYGQPAQVKQDDIRTASGVTFKSIQANWRFGNLHVDFESGRENRDLGTVRVYTNKYAAPATR